MRPLLVLLAVFTCCVVCQNKLLTADDVVIKQSTVLSSDIDGNLTITNGAAVLAQDIQISGDVYVDSLSSFYGKGVFVGGRLTVILSSNLTLRKSGTTSSTVMGDVEIQSCVGGIRLFDTNFNGQVLLENNAAYDIIIKECNFNHDVQMFFNSAQRKTVFRDNVLVGDWQEYRNKPYPNYFRNQLGGAFAKGSFIAVKSRGHEGDEQLQLQIDGQPVRDWTTIRKYREFRYRANDYVAPNRIRVAFINDDFAADFDRTLFVDELHIDGRQFPTESTSVYSTGTWLPHDGVQPGHRLSETLHVDGYFQFDWPQQTDTLIRGSLESLLPQGWSYDLHNDGLDVRLKTHDSAGNAAFDVRFGATGVISELNDSQTGERLNAPSYQGEVTDRVMQWVIWEIGPGLRYDHPSLPPFEDRFNLTQAGTFNNTINRTADVDLDRPAGQLDVWAVCDNQWQWRLDPFLDGSMSSLTRSTALQGGAILVRRVVRLGETKLLGQQTDFENPYFEAWSPFSDSAFSAMALSIDENGSPDEYFLDSVDIPNYPERPVAETRGWAMAYDHTGQNTRPNVAVVFGRDIGRVFRGDGTIEAPRRYVLNSMDFAGGMAILPGFWPAELPNGSLIDQWLLFVPAKRIDGATGARLDALAARLPAPQVFHPGASMDSEMKAIENRLKYLRFEAATPTDHLGLVQ